jgi:NTE family protein
MTRSLVTGLALLLIAGCSSYGEIDNAPIPPEGVQDPYSFNTRSRQHPADDQVAFFVSFSGGGTRAAALAYGVLQELRDAQLTLSGQPRSLLDEVDTISAVSGGSFTAAYYGLFGDRIFDDFEQVFLKRDIEGYLIAQLFNPLTWLQFKQRTDLTAEFYDRKVFEGARYADMRRGSAPLILINASDLAQGQRFAFTQEYFNLLCSDLSSYPVARAVTASSAVPLLFQPVVLENYDTCTHSPEPWLLAAQRRSRDNPQLFLAVEGLLSLFDKQERPYVHLVDGGITDNLGLRALTEMVDIIGDSRRFMAAIERTPPEHMVILTVNAATSVNDGIDKTRASPSLRQTIGAVTDAQLHRYNAATLSLVTRELKHWAEDLSTPSRPVTPYFIQVSFNEVATPEIRRFLNRIPTSFSLSDEQVDRLIETGRRLLRKNPEFQRLIANLGGHRPPATKPSE